MKFSLDSWTILSLNLHFLIIGYIYKPKKYVRKRRLIIDLSAPHSCHIPSINSIIPFDDNSMCYQKVDNAIKLIKMPSLNNWLAKTDITSVFKVMPLNPDFWHLAFGVKWQRKFYFRCSAHFRLPPQPPHLRHTVRDALLDTAKQLQCSISSSPAQWLLHSLFRPPSLWLHHGVGGLHKLGVPISEDPSHTLEFQGITLNTSNFIYSRPKEKIGCIIAIRHFYWLFYWNKTWGAVPAWSSQFCSASDSPRPPLYFPLPHSRPCAGP